MIGKIKSDSIGPLYMTIKSRIEEDILNGNYTDGDFLCTIKSLCGKYDISIITARKAVELMVNDGTVTCRSSRGIFVANIQKLVSSFSLKRYVAVIHSHTLDGMSPYFSLRLGAMTQAFAEKGIGVKILPKEQKRPFNEILPLSSLKGLIPSSSVLDENEIAYFSSQIPVLFFHDTPKKDDKNIIFVLHDYEKIVKLAVEYLKKRPIKKLLIVGHDEEADTKLARLIEKKTGLGTSYLKTDMSTQGGRDAASRIMKDSKSTSIIATDDFIGLGLVEGYLKQGKEIRESGRFIVLGNPRFAVCRELRIPTVGCDPCLIGRTAAEVMNNAISHNAPPPGVVKVEPEIFVP